MPTGEKLCVTIDLLGWIAWFLGYRALKVKGPLNVKFISEYVDYLIKLWETCLLDTDGRLDFRLQNCKWDESWVGTYK